MAARREEVTAKSREDGHCRQRGLTRAALRRPCGLRSLTAALPLQETLGRVAESGLPALLLQCLYLFFVFPPDEDEVLENDVQVQRMFVQVSEKRTELWAEPTLCLSEMFGPLSSGTQLTALPVFCTPGRPVHGGRVFFLCLCIRALVLSQRRAPSPRPLQPLLRSASPVQLARLSIRTLLPLATFP